MTSTGKLSICYHEKLHVMLIYNHFSIKFQILFFRHKFFLVGFEVSSLCLLCNLADKTPLNLFFLLPYCEVFMDTVRQLLFRWFEVSQFNITDCPIWNIKWQFNFWKYLSNKPYTVIFKLHIYKSCKKHSLNLHYIIPNTHIVKTLEEGIASVSDRKSKKFL